MNKLIGQYPDASGHFGPYGGRFVGETLMSALLDVEAAWASVKNDPAFMATYHALLRDYAAPPRSIAPRDFPTTSAARGFGSSAKIAPIPARTKSTTSSARACSPATWANGG